ncbi:MAG: gamma-glutamylcyclotransferase family protein [Pseudomonadota bacterium]
MTDNETVSSGDLFVFYGLLKQGASGMPDHIDLDAAGAFLGSCRFAGCMYSLDGFPGVVEGEGLCHGIRYRVDDAKVVAALDAFEDVSGDPSTSLYIRRQVPLLDDRAQKTGEQAWIYWYNQPVDASQRVESDNWPLEAGRSRKGT